MIIIIKVSLKEKNNVLYIEYIKQKHLKEYIKR